MPKKKTKSKHAQDAKAKTEGGNGKSRHARGPKEKAADGKNKVDEDNPELDCRFCDFTSESEKILRKHIRSEHVAEAR